MCKKSSGSVFQVWKNSAVKLMFHCKTNVSHKYKWSVSGVARIFFIVVVLSYITFLSLMKICA